MGSLTGCRHLPIAIIWRHFKLTMHNMPLTCADSSALSTQPSMMMSFLHVHKQKTNYEYDSRIIESKFSVYRCAARQDARGLGRYW
eukprot:1595660-Pleurochrysis_carterae.AAC.1